MEDRYLIVSTKVLPDYLTKVIEAKGLLEAHKASNVTEASKMVGISRTTFYRYKDHVFTPAEKNLGGRLVINMVLSHEPGMLLKVISCISSLGANILTVSQSVPVAGMADVMFSIDTGGVSVTVDELVRSLGELAGVLSVNLVAVG